MIHEGKHACNQLTQAAPQGNGARLPVWIASVSREHLWGTTCTRQQTRGRGVLQRLRPQHALALENVEAIVIFRYLTPNNTMVGYCCCKWVSYIPRT